MFLSADCATWRRSCRRGINSLSSSAHREETQRYVGHHSHKPKRRQVVLVRSRPANLLTTTGVSNLRRDIVRQESNKLARSSIFGGNGTKNGHPEPELQLRPPCRVTFSIFPREARCTHFPCPGTSSPLSPVKLRLDALMSTSFQRRSVPWLATLAYCLGAGQTGRCTNIDNETISLGVMSHAVGKRRHCRKTRSR